MTAASLEVLEQALAHYEPRQAPDGVWEIEIYLSAARSAVQSLSRLPLAYVELDEGIVAYVFEQIELLPKGADFRVVLRVPPEAMHEGEEETIQRLLRLYLAQRLKRFRRQEKAALRDMLKALAAGMVFLFGCQMLRFVLNFPGYPTLTNTLSEGLLVLGWVALWNPYDRFLFSWLPALKKSKLARRMCDIEVHLRPLVINDAKS